MQAGDKIPADGILISGHLHVDNSALNGEAEECKKTEAPQDFQLADDITGETFVDQHSLFRGAVVFDGEVGCPQSRLKDNDGENGRGNAGG